MSHLVVLECDAGWVQMKTEELIVFTTKLDFEKDKK